MSKRILIIDDEEHIRRMMRLTLEAAGYEVSEAHDGQEGLSLYADGSFWDGVVLDQRMPGMDGLEVLSKLKKADPRARVVMATAYASIELAVDAMKLGASDFLRKPMTPEMLRNAVAATISKRINASTKVVAPAEAHPGQIETLTMNGFTILDSEEGDSADERHFTVLNPNGSSQEVIVHIDKEAVDYVERMIRKSLPAESSFWTVQARHLLSDYIWSQGHVPSKNFLVLSEISRDELPLADHWRTK